MGLEKKYRREPGRRPLELVDHVETVGGRAKVRGGVAPQLDGEGQSDRRQGVRAVYPEGDRVIGPLAVTPSGEAVADSRLARSRSPAQGDHKPARRDEHGTSVENLETARCLHDERQRDAVIGVDKHFRRDRLCRYRG